MNAEETFTKLGFERQNECDRFVHYVKNDTRGEKRLSFYLADREFRCFRWNNDGRLGFAELSMDELKAAVKQAEEFGW